jgi:hypothetical protein
MKKYILIIFLVGIGLAFSIFLYLQYDCRCTYHTYYQLKNRIFYYNKIDTYIEENKDSIVDWKALIQSDSTLEIIPINNKKDSLEFFVVNKNVKFDRITYYYGNKYHLYRTLQYENYDFKSTIREQIDDKINSR